MTTARVRQALEAKLNTWAAAQTPAMSVAWENIDFTPPALSGRYVRANLIPGRTWSGDLLGARRSHEGIFQVTLYVPTKNGPNAAEALAASLDTAFPLTTPMEVSGFKVWITSPMSAAQGLPIDGRWVVPVSCAYATHSYA